MPLAPKDAGRLQLREGLKMMTLKKILAFFVSVSAIAGTTSCTQSRQPDWGQFARASANFSPTPLLMNTISDWFPVSRGAIALDLGAGGGKDTRYLLSLGWRVVAMDSDIQAVESLRSNLPAVLARRLHVVYDDFETFPWDLYAGRATLVNASYALPFCAAADFQAIWRGIAGTLHSGGIFTGHFFGLDNWILSTAQFTKSEVEELLARDFDLLSLTEQHGLGSTLDEGQQFWHVFSVVAKKR